jgi:hypothetical protein
MDNRRGMFIATQAPEGLDDALLLLSLEEALAVIRRVASASPMAHQVVAETVREVIRRRATGAEEPPKLGKDKAWGELTSAEIEAAQAIGYDEAAWEAGEATATCSHPWLQLTMVEQSAATVRRAPITRAPLPRAHAPHVCVPQP